MSTTLIHRGPAYELSVTIEASPYGHHMSFASFVPTARNPQEHRRFQAHLAREQLAALHQAIGTALHEGSSASHATS